MSEWVVAGGMVGGWAGGGASWRHQGSHLTAHDLHFGLAVLNSNVKAPPAC